MKGEYKMNFQIGKCPKCGKNAELMFSNNPIVTPVCFSCIESELAYNNLEHADFFCRTYNIPFKPNTWMELVNRVGERVFYEYAKMFYEEDKDNLYYESSTRDVWRIANREWEKCRTQVQILNKLEPVKDSYVERGRLKWGPTYTFEDIVKLDSTYNQTLKSNNITNPLQKEAVKMLCKIQIELNAALLAGDTKAVKDYSSAYSNFAKQAGLEDMIEQTKTDDITTVAELYDYMEKQGFQFKFYDNFDRDEVDRTLKDITESNRRLILESTGLGTLLEEMARKRAKTAEEKYTEEVTSRTSLQELLEYNPEETEVETEDDSSIIDGDLDLDDAAESPSLDTSFVDGVQAGDN